MNKVIRSLAGLALLGLFLAAIPGCPSGGTPKPQEYGVPMKTPLEEAKSLLQNYAAGGSIGSEAASYSDLVNAVRQSDPAKADILEKGFAELQKTPPQGVAAKAKEILAQLGQ